MEVIEGHPIFFLSREKVRKNKIFKNNELKIDPLFGNTSPSDSVHGFVFDFDDSLANNELLISALRQAQGKLYQYPVCPAKAGPPSTPYPDSKVQREAQHCPVRGR
jgi:hypothetical protein